MLYRNLVMERYIISKHLNTSYSDTANITIREKNYLLSFIEEDMKKLSEMLQKQQESRKSTGGAWTNN